MMTLLKRCVLFLGFIFLVVGLTACHDKPLNSPHLQKDAKANILYSSFAERPKTLDPAKSYSSDESVFTTQIYEPPLQYHYLKRPYQLIPATAEEVPLPTYYNKNDQVLPNTAPTNEIAYSVYTIKIKPGILYQPHPAFAKNEKGEYLYHHLSQLQLENKYRLQDFKHTGTRELTAEDYVYQIKRLANPEVQSPLFGLMGHYIIGLDDLAKTLQQEINKKKNGEFIDLRKFSLLGVKEIDRYTYEIKVKGKYPQFIYWLAMPFFAPVPWEADLFYSQPGMEKKNLSLSWYPVGTGPYMLTENNPNKQMVLEKNPNFHHEVYPSSGEPKDKENGLLEKAGQTLPFIDKVVFDLEKESIPRWSKFLQGYYDTSAISADSFDQAIKIDEQGEPVLSPDMQQKGIKLDNSIGLGTMYLGFNMNDDVVGGLTPKARKLRQAISIALDYEDYISIFLNGRGVPAQGPIPPGIFGTLTGKKGINPFVYRWADNQAERLSIDDAKKLLAEAGYPNGRDAKTGKPLILNYDTVGSSGPDDKSRLDWMRKQFAKLGIQLHIRATTYNRFQEKVRNGNVQMFSWGWLADYPDPENFLFLLYGKNGKVKYGGENAVNYFNKEYDELYQHMKDLPNGPKRQEVINKMLDIIRRDAPWVFGYHPMNYALLHQWNGAYKIPAIGGSDLKYRSINPILRDQKRIAWNKPIWWPVILFFIILLIIIIPIVIKYWIKGHKPKEKV